MDAAPFALPLGFPARPQKTAPDSKLGNPTDFIDQLLSHDSAFLLIPRLANLRFPVDINCSGKDSNLRGGFLEGSCTAHSKPLQTNETQHSFGHTSLHSGFHLTLARHAFQISQWPFMLDSNSTLIQRCRRYWPDGRLETIFTRPPEKSGPYEFSLLAFPLIVRFQGLANGQCLAFGRL